MISYSPHPGNKFEQRMGTFYVDCTVENVSDPTRSEIVSKSLVDTGSEYTWIPSAALDRIGVERLKQITFVMANGGHVTRDVGFAIVRAQGFFTVDEVVFGLEGDLSLLGARSLEGFNARVDSHAKKLVAAGPVLAAATCSIDRP
jgi:predicted aspartyl protease